MVGRYPDRAREGVIQMRECDFVFRTNLLTNDDLVDVIELIPVLVIIIHVTIKRLKLRTAWDRHVESFGGKERIFVKEI